MRCDVCRKFDSLGVDAAKNIHIHTNWTTGGVTYNGTERKQQMRSLRNKILDHNNSISHRLCLKKLVERKNKHLVNCLAKANSHLTDTTVSNFKTAYYIAKEDRPYSDHFSLVQLQQSNGVNMGKTLHSRWSSVNIINHISTEMKRKLCEVIINNKCKISLMMDESTTISKKSTLIIYIRTSLCNYDPSSSDAFAFPLQLIELPSLSSKDIVETLYNVLNKYGFDETFLSHNLIGLCSDGAANMIGSKSGVLTVINQKYPNTLVWHCMCHRIELAVGDSVDEINAVNHVKLFLDKVYSLYSQSPANTAELESIAASLGVELRKIGRVLDTRWAASSYRSLSAVWGGFKALHSHFLSGSTASKKSSTQRATYKGLATTLSSKHFVIGLAILTDALEEVSHLSVALQKESVQIDRAYTLLERTIRALEQQKDGEGGDCYQELEKGDMEVLKGVPLHDGTRTPVINKNQFLQALIDNLSSRLDCTVASNRKRSGQPDTYAELKELIDEIHCLDPDHWEPELKTPWREGEVKLASLCSKLSILFTTETKSAYRDFIDNPNATNKIVSEIKAAVSTLPISSADCERGFSTMNLICSKSRNRLLIDHISSLMFISLVGPPVVLYKPEAHVKSWLVSHRNSDDNQTRKATCDYSKSRYQAVWSIF